MTKNLPPVEEVLREPGLSYEESFSALLAAGYDDLHARNIAALATGRSHGDVKRRPAKRKALRRY